MGRFQFGPAWPRLSRLNREARPALTLLAVALLAAASYALLAAGRGGGALLPGRRLLVVYFAYLPDSDFDGLLDHHLRALAGSGLPRAASVHVVLSTAAASDDDPAALGRLERASAAARRHVPAAAVSRSLGNTFEYPGIRAVWDLARAVPAAAARDTLLLYFHSKGMVNVRHAQNRTRDFDRLFGLVVQPWREVSQIFAGHPAVDKVGYAASELGFMWVNFWWARASYLRGLVPPMLSTRDRYYYEQWLALRDGGAQRQGPATLGDSSEPAGGAAAAPGGWHCTVWRNCSDCWSLAAERPLGTCWEAQRVANSMLLGS